MTGSLQNRNARVTSGLGVGRYVDQVAAQRAIETVIREFSPSGAHARGDNEMRHSVLANVWLIVRQRVLMGSERGASRHFLARVVSHVVTQGPRDFGL